MPRPRTYRDYVGEVSNFRGNVLVSKTKRGPWMPAHDEQVLAWIHRWDHENSGARRGNKYQVRMKWIGTQGGFAPDDTETQVQNVKTGDRLYIREI